MHVLGEQQRHRDWTRGNRKHFGLAAEDPDLQSQEEWLRYVGKFSKHSVISSHLETKQLQLSPFPFSLCYFQDNNFLHPQWTRTRRPWREAAWRNPCQSWTTTSMMCSHIWRRTARGFPSTTCCTKSHPSMARQETDSVWVLKRLIVHGWSFFSHKRCFTGTLLIPIKLFIAHYTLLWCPESCASRDISCFTLGTDTYSDIPRVLLIGVRDFSLL